MDSEQQIESLKEENEVLPEAEADEGEEFAGEDEGVENQQDNTSNELEIELERERSLRKISENKILCLSLLQKQGLPMELCDLLVCENEDETRKRVEDVSKFVKKAINEEVSKRLATIKAPSEGKSSMTRAEFKTLSQSDMQRLYKTDKQLYRELSKNN